MVFPDAAASSPLPLNGDRVNPLKVHPSAAVTGPGSGREGTKGRRRKEKRQRAVRRKSAAGQCCSLHAEREKQTRMFRPGPR